MWFAAGNLKNLAKAIVLVVCCGLCTSAQAPSREYQIKAAFLFNFTQFVEWPPSSFASHKTPLTIGILGEDPFGLYLDNLLKGESAQSHTLNVKRFQTLDEAKACHVLFINKDGENQQVLSALKGKNILTVGEDANFISQGGMVRFHMVENKIHLQINPEAAKSSGITISSKLLRVAEIVVPK